MVAIIPALAVVHCAGLAPAYAAPPQRIVSLNLCTDQILLDLVPRERIAGLSFLGADPTMSPRFEEARGFPSVHGSAEEVLALNPDLVLAGMHSTPATVSLLERLGRRVVKVPMASSFAGIRDLVRLMGEAAGETGRAHALVRTFDQQLDAARALADRSGPAPTVVAMQVNSLASGPGSLLDEVFTAAGLRNLASEPDTSARLGPGGRLPLETLLLNPPDLLVLANSADDYRTVLADNLRHPAFTRLAAERPSVHLAMRDWLCGTPAVAGLVEKLSRMRASFEARLRGAP
jgi:iron complex transport system substrate-binding protein